MPKLLLINPSNKHKGLGNIRSTAWPPLNLPYLAALTPSHYTIEVIDENIEAFSFRQADIVGITAYTSSVTRGYEIAQLYREKGITTIMGGIHVSMMPDEALNYCDTVVIGEAEGVWAQVLKDFESGSLQRRYQGVWTDLSSLPIPRREVLQSDYYKWGSIQTSRGCPMNCSFCSVTAFNGRRFRRRSMDDVIEELAQIPQKNIMLTDDNIIGHTDEDKAWAKVFFTRIREKGIKKYFFAQGSIQFGEDQELIDLAAKGGLKILFIGIESVNPETLKSYKKTLNLKRLLNDKYYEHIDNIRRGGIAVLGAFLLGNDDDSLSSFDATLEFIKSSHLDIIQITKPTPLPGTQFWDQLSAEGRIIKLDFPKDWEKFRLTKMVYVPEKMSIEDVYEGFTYVKNKYFSWPETVKRTFSTLLTTKNLITTVMAYKFNQSYRKAFIESEHHKIYNQQDLNKKFRLQGTTS
jgi:radical SAM superfamily enzyme YgiQ (UPF0313 family)